MERIYHLLKITCSGMTSDEKISFLRSNGFYSVKALESSPKEKLDVFEKFLESQVELIEGFRIVDGYIVRVTDDGRNYFSLPKKYEV